MPSCIRRFPAATGPAPPRLGELRKVAKKMQPDPLLFELISARINVWHLALRHWLEYELGHWQWWFCAVMLFLPAVLWWKLADKKRIFELLTVGMFVAGISSFLDVIGSEMVLWVYPSKLLPTSPRFLTVDTTCLAVIYMLLYQHVPGWRQYLAALTGAALAMTFIVEPLMVQANMYRLLTWRYVYSFPIYIAMGAVAKWATERIKAGAGKG